MDISLQMIQAHQKMKHGKVELHPKEQQEKENLKSDDVPHVEVAQEITKMLDLMLWLLGNQMRFMDNFLDNIQIDEFDCVVPKDAMCDIFEDDWESVTETDMEDWILVEGWFNDWN